MNVKDIVTFLVLAGLAVAVARYLAPEPVSGRVRVIDGDSLRLDGTIVRLAGIDAPEFRQTCRDRRGREYACGRRAAERLRRLVAGGTVRCRLGESDRYGRRLGVCRAGEEELNAAMVAAGWAVAYVRHSLAYSGAEAAARAARRGIWQGRFEMPEKWRARMRARR